MLKISKQKAYIFPVMVKRTWLPGRDDKSDIPTKGMHTSRGDEAKLGHDMDRTWMFRLSLLGLRSDLPPTAYSARCMLYEWIASEATVCSRPISLDAIFVCFEEAYLWAVGLMGFGLLRNEKFGAAAPSSGRGWGAVGRLWRGVGRIGKM